MHDVHEKRTPRGWTESVAQQKGRFALKTSSPVRTRSARPGDQCAARVDLLIDAEWFRLCAAAARARLTGTTIGRSRVGIDAAGVARWLTGAPLELALPGATAFSLERVSGRVHDTPGEDRDERRRRRHLHGVLRAAGLVVTCPRWSGATSAASLARDLVDRAWERRVDTALLIAGDRALAGAVDEARRHGVDVILLIAPGAAALVAEPLRLAAPRVVGLHPEVFEALHHVHEA